MSQQRNVVLITVDSIRYDRCGFAGDESVSTPALDEMADRGLNFRNAIAPGSATPDSVPITLTGEFPPMNTNNPSVAQWVRGQAQARQTIAERFSAHGYATGGFSTNPWLSRYSSFNQGFDYFEDFFGNDSGNLVSNSVERDSFVSSTIRNINDWITGQNMFMSWTAFYDEIIDWWENAEAPRFLWVFLVDVHVPYYAGSEYRTQSKLVLIPANLWLFISALHDIAKPFDGVLEEAYSNCIQHTDEFLRRIKQDLSADNPLIAVYGDHGDEFGEFGRYGHGEALTEPLIHVPFIIDNGPSETVDDLVSLSSVPEIVFDLATRESEVKNAGNRWGQSVVASWIGETVAIRAPEWKYVRDTMTDSEEMFRINTDQHIDERWENPPESLVASARQLADSAHHDRLEKRSIITAASNVTGDGRL